MANEMALLAYNRAVKLSKPGSSKPVKLAGIGIGLFLVGIVHTFVYVS